MATAANDRKPISQPPYEDRSLTLYPEEFSLLTDLYELTMAACYVGEGIEQRNASFELFVRKFPKDFGYLIAMGLEQALDYLEHFKFTPAQISALQSTGIFANAPDRFWSVLENARFEGDVWAVPEGTAIFPNEPILRVDAPFWQAQVIETYVLNAINYQSLIATRAARVRDVAGEHALLLEFGTRRAFSPQASLWAARAALAAGFNSTSNVLAAFKLGRKPTGTIAHSLVMALTALEGSEMQAFNAFHHYFPGAPLLIDTYDTLDAARQLSKRLQAGEMELRGVRLDSGDLAQLSQQVRAILPDIAIFGSGDLDEWEIARLQAEGAKIDGYGVGTRLLTGEAINGVYKLVEIDGNPVMKRSSGKMTYPGRKQVFRHIEGGQVKGDRLALVSEEADQNEAQSKPLLEPVVRDGQRLKPPETLETIAKRTAKSVAALPPQTRQLDNPTPIPLTISEATQTLAQTTQQNL
jgi:nicotinate phosphoribosyltransferase